MQSQDPSAPSGALRSMDSTPATGEVQTDSTTVALQAAPIVLQPPTGGSPSVVRQRHGVGRRKRSGPDLEYLRERAQREEARQERQFHLERKLQLEESRLALKRQKFEGEQQQKLWERQMAEEERCTRREADRRQAEALEKLMEYVVKQKCANCCRVQPGAET